MLVLSLQFVSRSCLHLPWTNQTAFFSVPTGFVAHVVIRGNKDIMAHFITEQTSMGLTELRLSHSLIAF